MAVDLIEFRKERIASALTQLPSDVRERPATATELDRFEEGNGVIPAEFRWFLQSCGGGVVGAERLDGVRTLAQSHEKYRREFGPPSGWSMENVFIIGWDGAGNPIGIHKRSGRILIEDHNFGGVHEVARSLFEFLEQQLHISVA
jgi:hypothetical protein